MPHAFATAALMIALGAVASPPPEPPAVQTATPAPALPEIGRVRANSPACATMRDLVIPSFSVAQRSDLRFAQTRARLPQYVELVVDKAHKTDVMRDSALAKLDADAASMLADAQVLDKMLADPRLKSSTDPDVAAERDGLARLAAVQKARAGQLEEFVMRERNVVAPNGIEAGGGIAPKMSLAKKKLEAPPRPPPEVNAPLGMPLLTGTDAMADKASVNEWSAGMAATVRVGENQAAKTFLPIAQNCR